MQSKSVYKIPNGKLLKVFLDYDKKRNLINNICITGDFFAYPEEAIELVENKLKNTILERDLLHEKIQSIVGSSSKQTSLFKKGKIILIDEIDGLSGTRDRGAIPVLARIIDETSHPIILTTLNPYESKFQPLRRKSRLTQY